jgi:ABC-type phosphate transport system auxiliary subunit
MAFVFLFELVLLGLSVVLLVKGFRYFWKRADVKEATENLRVTEDNFKTIRAVNVDEVKKKQERIKKVTDTL